VQEIDEEIQGLSDTKIILSKQLASFTVSDDVQTVNKILPSELLVQDSELNYVVPLATSEALETITETVELQYKLTQLDLLQIDLNNEKALINDLFKRLDNIIYLLRSSII
jgi:hypothetical protein